MKSAKKLSPSQFKEEEKWNYLTSFIAHEAQKMDYFESDLKFAKDKGSLVIIGSGIKSVGQFTLEAVSHIKSADKVLFCVSDPATEVFIKELNPDAMDLYVFYEDDKKHYDADVQIAEVCLFYARKGLNVVAIFYGHPGVLMLSSHRAFKIALKQGIKAYMLPAVSTEDCLFADLGIDPSFPGLQTFDATDLLLRQRQILTDANVIILQVGFVGDLGFRRNGCLNENFHILIEHLQKIYGEDYVITHYIGAQYPVCKALIEEIPLAKFYESDVAKRVIRFSTFYIPPKVYKDIDSAMAVRLGIIPKIEDAWLIDNKRDLTKYGPQEINAIKALDDYTVPVSYAHTPPSKAARYLGALSQDVKLLRQHTINPEKNMETFGLSKKEKEIINSGHSGHICTMLKIDSGNVAEQLAIHLVTDPQFASKYAAQVCKYLEDSHGLEHIEKWLLFEGYDTTPEDVITAAVSLQKTSLLMWSGKYLTNANGIYILVQGMSPPLDGRVWINNVYIKKIAFVNKTLTWSESDGNPSSAELNFTINENGVFIFSGKYWEAGSSKPPTDNLTGEDTGFEDTPGLKENAQILVNGLRSIDLMAAASEAIVALNKYLENPTQENKEIYQKAMDKAEEASFRQSDAEKNVNHQNPSEVDAVTT